MMKTIYILIAVTILLCIANDESQAQCVVPQTSGTTLSCGTASATLSATTQTRNMNHRWYTVASGGYAMSGIVTVNTGSAPVTVTTYTAIFSSTTTYYVSTYNPTTYCESSRTPVTVTVNAGTTVSIAPSGNPTYVCSSNSSFLLTATAGSSYQWKVGGSTISGATSQTYHPTSTGNYTVVVGTSCGSKETSALPVTIYTASSLSVSISGPNNFCAGTNAPYTASVSNGLGSSVNYQWYLNGSAAGTNSSAYNSATLSNGNTISCTTSLQSGVCATPGSASSNVITLTVSPNLPVSSSISGNGTLCYGLGGGFSASVINGGSSPAYQWLLNGNSVTNNTVGVPVYVYSPNTALKHGDQISCRVTSNATCPINNPAISNIIPITLTNPLIPTVSISTTPSISGGDANGPYLNICQGTSVTFNVSNPINGGSSPTYQWFSNSSPIATGITYTSTSLVNDQKISVQMTSNASCVTTATATSGNVRMVVSPILTPTLTISPINPTICEGINRTFTATPTNGGSPSFVWKVNGIAQSGQTGTTFSSTGFTNGQSVSVEMTSNNTCQTTNLVSANGGTITVNPNLPVSLSISGSGALCNGLGGGFSASVINGGGSPQYQWKVNGSNVTNQQAGPPANVYVATGQLNNNDVVTCELTSNATCATGGSPATSNGIAISVIPQVTPSVTFTTNPSINGGVGGPSLTICNGANVQFSASSAYSGSYQWYLNSSAVQAGSTYAPSSLANNDQVSVTMTGITGCVNTTTVSSFNLLMKVDNTNPTITLNSIAESPPGTQASVTFTASVANAGASPFYQWKLNGSDIAGANSISYTKAAWSNGDQFSCFVKRSEGCSAISDAITLLTPPLPPSGLWVGSSPGINQVNVEWTDNSTNEDGFIIERCTIPGVTYAEIARTSANVTTYTNLSVPAGIYSYRVCAYNSVGKSTYTAERYITTITLQADLTEGGTITSSPDGSVWGEGNVNAFDNDLTTKLFIYGSNGFVQYEFANGNAYAVKQYTISSANDIPERDPKEWKLQGSNDGSAWLDLDYRTNINFSTRFETQTFNIVNTITYKFYKFVFIDNHGNDNLQFSEIQLFGEPQSAITAIVSKISVNFTDGNNIAPLPWNNTSHYTVGSTMYNLKNDLQQPTTAGLEFMDSWDAYNGGGMTGGIFPDEVMLTYFYFYSGTHNIRIFGLNPARKYTFSFFGSRNSSGRASNYTIGSTSVYLLASYNTNEIVKIENVSPNAAGEVTISVTKPNEAAAAVLNALIIDEIITTSAYTSSSIMNSVETITFDENEGVKSQSITYYDDLSRPVQSISRNISANMVIASQPVYDAQGRAAIGILPVPVAQSSLNYITGLVTNPTGTPYNYTNFDKAGIPDAISGKLADYYSTSNTLEPYTPESAYPYTRVEFSKLQPGVTRKSAMAGNEHRMGSGHETQSYSMPVPESELAVFSSNFSALTDVTFETKGVTKSIAIDADGNTGIGYTSANGQAIVTCYADVSAPDQTVTYPFDPAFGYLDIHLSKAGTVTLSGPCTIYDLTTDLQVGTVTYTGSPSLATGFYRIVYSGIPPVSASVSYNINYKGHSFQLFDKAGRSRYSFSPKGFNEWKASGKVVTDINKYASTSEYANSLGWLSATQSPDEGRTEFLYRTDGKIRFSQNAKQKIDGKFSYTNYDAAGRAIEVGEKIGTFASADVTANIAGGDQITSTVYDTPDATFTQSGLTQNYTEGRVVKNSNIASSTWYSYTYDGKLDWMAQDIDGANLGRKIVEYQYDFTGNVTRVIYQRGQSDEFIHRYKYDSDSRLEYVYTQAHNEVTEKLQAHYLYYAHGPLKRVELATNLQGIDYVYTINGWLKSINHPDLTAKDPGADGFSGNHSTFKPDVFGMTLDYFSGDYLSVAGAAGTGQAPLTNRFNGNITASRWGTSTPAAGISGGAYQYTYNNRNWLTQANFGAVNGSTFIIDAAGKYQEGGLQYDANGNITTLTRFADAAMDNLTYNYNTTQNRLGYVTDATPATAITEDIETQATGNYTYNAIGQLTGNVADNQYFTYDVYGHVTNIKKSDGTILATNTYDDKGFRVKKTDGSTTSWYVRDASGNILATYYKDANNPVHLDEVNLFGASRLGMAQANTIGTINKYVYELTDHLGNVRSTIFKDATNALVIESNADYYPFGMVIPTRNQPASKAYRFGYQGQFAEKDAETGLNHFEARDYDNRIGRWLTPDQHKQFWSSYIGMGNNPITYCDKDGRDIIVLIDWQGAMMFGHVALLIGNDNDGWSYISKNGGQNQWWRSFKDKSDVTFEKKAYHSVGEFFNSYDATTGKTYGNRYDDGVWIQATPEQDYQAMIQALATARKDYKLLTSSCNTTVLDAISRAKGFKFNWSEMVPKFTIQDLKLFKGTLDKITISPTLITSFEVGVPELVGTYDDNDNLHPAN